jgi:hypothetical protein
MAIQPMEIFQVDDDGRLFISAAIDDWSSVGPHGIDVVIDLEGGLDACIPTVPNHCVYVYFPIADDDQQLPNLIKLRAIARMAATLVAEGHRVLSHCGMGFSRSALMAADPDRAGHTGPQAVGRLRGDGRRVVQRDVCGVLSSRSRPKSQERKVMSHQDLVVARAFLNQFEADVASALEAAVSSRSSRRRLGGMNPACGWGHRSSCW